jgi:uncharacterized protein
MGYRPMVTGKYRQILEEMLARVRLDEDVLAVFLFGSVARKEQTPLSDMDMCLVLMPQSTPFEPLALSRKRLDYLNQPFLDIQIFQQLPLYVRRRILKEGQTLFVRNETLLYELAFRTAQAFEDFKRIYTSYLEEVAIAGS